MLEDGAFRMVGGTELVRVNVRVIAATNKHLQQAMEAGKFREDLFYRLQIVPITVPPLHERSEDIPILIEHFLEQFAAKHKRRRKRFSSAAMELCQRFPWPGNVRQLRNAVERLVITLRGATIEVGGPARLSARTRPKRDHFHGASGHAAGRSGEVAHPANVDPRDQQSRRSRQGSRHQPPHLAIQAQAIWLAQTSLGTGASS